MNLLKRLTKCTRGKDGLFLLSYYTNDFDGGRYESYAVKDQLYDSIFKMLSGIESQTFKWSLSKEASSSTDYGSRLGSFCLHESVKNMIRFESCGLTSFDSILEKLMATGTRFRRLEGVADVVSKSPLFVILC